MSVKIIPFQPLHAERFRGLNLAWLEKYFYVEPKDKKLLENCKKSILDKGEFIFLAEYMGEIAECFSFIPYKTNKYELGKMAVDPNHQGLRIGQQLL